MHLNSWNISYDRNFLALILKQMVQDITSLKGRGFSSVRFARIATGERIQSAATRPERPQAK